MEQQKWLQRWQRIVSNLCHPLALWHDPRYDPQSLVGAASWLIVFFYRGFDLAQNTVPCNIIFELPQNIIW